MPQSVKTLKIVYFEFYILDVVFLLGKKKIIVHCIRVKSYARCRLQILDIFPIISVGRAYTDRDRENFKTKRKNNNITYARDVIIYLFIRKHAMPHSV